MANFVVDSFTDTDATNLTSHTGETGATWAKNTDSSAVASPVITTNRVHANQAATQNVYASGTPGSANYSVSVDVNLPAGSFGTFAGVTGRALTNATTFYAILRNGTEWRLYKLVAGSGTVLGTVSVAVSSSVTYRLTLTMTGTAISGMIQRLSDNWFLNSSAAWQPSSTTFASATDSAITAAGKAGLWLNGADSGASGAQWDNFQAGDPPTAQNAVIGITNANLFLSPYNWYTSGTAWAQTVNPGAYLKAYVEGTSYKLNVDVSPLVTGSATAAQYPTIAYSINGAAWTTYQLLSTDTAITLATGLSDLTRTVEVYLQGTTTGIDRWTNPYSVLRVYGLTLDVGKGASPPTLRTKRMLVYGDSITEGAAALASGGLVTAWDSTQTFAQLLARVYDAEVGIVGFSGQDYDVAGNANVPALSAAWDLYTAGHSRLTGGLFSPAPDYLITNHGTNGVTVSATVAAILASWRAAAGTACKILATYPAGYSATPVANILSGFNSYQTATPDPNAKLLDHGASVITTAQTTFDSTHPNVRGHAQFGALLASKAATALTSGAVPSIGSPLIRALQ